MHEGRTQRSATGIAVFAADAMAVATKRFVAEQPDEATACALLGISRPTLARLCGGLNVKNCTVLHCAAVLKVDLVGMVAASGAGDADGEDANGEAGEVSAP